MIGIAGYVAGLSILDFSRSMREAVPDRFAFAAFLPRAFDLISSSGGSPEEVLGKGNLGGCIKLPGREVASTPEAAVRAAFDETLHAENKPAGSAARALANAADCKNSRRVRRKIYEAPLENDTTAALCLIS